MQKVISAEGVGALVSGCARRCHDTERTIFGLLHILGGVHYQADTTPPRHSARQYRLKTDDYRGFVAVGECSDGRAERGLGVISALEEQGRICAEVLLVQVRPHVVVLRGRCRQLVGARARGRVQGRGRHVVRQVVQGDARAVHHWVHVLLADVGGARVVHVGVSVCGHLDGRSPGGRRDEGALVPVRVGAVPDQRAVVLDLDRHQTPGKVARVLQARHGLSGREEHVDVGHGAVANAGQAINHEPVVGIGGGEVFVSVGPVHGLDADAAHRDVLVLRGALREALELVHTA